MRSSAPYRLPLDDALERERRVTVASRASRGLGWAVLGVLAALFALVAVLPVVVALAPDTRDRLDEPMAVMALLALTPLGGLGCWLLWRQVRAAKAAEMLVTDVALITSGLDGWPVHLAWSSLRPNPAPGACADVELVMGRGDSVHHELRFFASGELAASAAIEQRLPLAALTVPHLRFCNGYELGRALLLQLASAPAPTLRIDSEVFVHLRVHPRSWAPMPWPRRTRRLLFLMALVPAGAWMWQAAWPTPVWQLVGGTVLALVAGALAATLLHQAAYPWLHAGPWQYLRPQGSLASPPASRTSGRKGQPRSSARR